MTETLNLTEFMARPGVIIDVRSPSEYLQGRLPGALSLPLFTDDERAEVGTMYKQQGSEVAISLGMHLVAPKIPAFIATARDMLRGQQAKIHCWRGGMRSAAMAMLLHHTAVPAVTLSGGYKAFRRWTLDVFARPYRYRILGGMTGTGKTAILKTMKQQGEQVIDLEQLANHRGSVFGAIGLGTQPSTEQFHNNLAMALDALDPNHPIWIENESRQIGSCHQPEALFSALRKAPLFVIERPLEERISILLEEYGNAPRGELIEATRRISKKLGGENTEAAVAAIQEDKLAEALKILLPYYDATYQHGLSMRRSPLHRLSAAKLSKEDWAKELTLG